MVLLLVKIKNTNVICIFLIKDRQNKTVFKCMFCIYAINFENLVHNDYLAIS